METLSYNNGVGAGPVVHIKEQHLTMALRHSRQLGNTKAQISFNPQRKIIIVIIEIAPRRYPPGGTPRKLRDALAVAERADFLLFEAAQIKHFDRILQNI